MSNNYRLCCQNMGKPVAINTTDGQEYRGIIRQVTPTHVFLEPLPNQQPGFGSGYYQSYQSYQPYQPQQPVQPYRPGFGLGIALGAIGTLAVLPWFFI